MKHHHFESQPQPELKKTPAGSAESGRSLYDVSELLEHITVQPPTNAIIRQFTEKHGLVDASEYDPKTHELQRMIFKKKDGEIVYFEDRERLIELAREAALRKEGVRSGRSRILQAPEDQDEAELLKNLREGDKETHY